MPAHKGEWIHDRARHILRHNPRMKKDIAYGVATQQAYAAGKAPKGWGTPQGRSAAHQKFDEPKRAYKKTADPSHKTKSAGLDLVSLLGFADEMMKIAQSPKPTTPGEVRAKVPEAGTALSTRRPRYSKVHKDPVPPSSTSDLAESAKTIQPPPVTMPESNM